MSIVYKNFINKKGKLMRIRLNQEYRNKIANRMRVHLEQEDTQEKKKYDEMKAEQISLNDKIMTTMLKWFRVPLKNILTFV
jgi:hypothetical protein